MFIWHSWLLLVVGRWDPVNRLTTQFSDFLSCFISTHPPKSVRNRCVIEIFVKSSMFIFLDSRELCICVTLSHTMESDLIHLVVTHACHDPIRSYWFWGQKSRSYFFFVISLHLPFFYIEKDHINLWGQKLQVGFAPFSFNDCCTLGLKLTFRCSEDTG